MLADLKITKVSHVINEFKFQQTIHEKKKGFVYTSITILIDELTAMRSKKPDIFTMENERSLWEGNVGLL